MCPDCGLLALKDAGKKMMECPICGWKGSVPPRKIMDVSQSSLLGKETMEKLALRRDGRLFYYRIYLKGNDDQKSDAITTIMDILNVTSMNTGDVIHLPLDKPFNPDELATIRKHRGVKKVTVF